MTRQTAHQPRAIAGPVVERVSPIDGRIVSAEAALDPSGCQSVAARAAAAFPAWSARPAAERGALLRRAAELLEQRGEAFCLAMAEEIGTASDWAWMNVRFGAEMLRETAFYEDEVCAEVAVRGEAARGLNSRVIRVPCGVVLGIAPWNAPLVLGARAIAAPLMCGNTVLLKGSEFAPRTYRLFGDVLTDAGFPEGVVQVLLARGEDSEAVADALIASPVVRRVNFTGSTRVGRRVAELCARHLKRPLLELGGQSAMLVLGDADLDLAVEAALDGGYRNQGQICMSTERLIVAETLADALVERLEARRCKLSLGDPRDPHTQIGPVVSAAAAERLAGLIGDAVSKGATLIGGGRVSDAYLEPTLLDRVEPDMRIYREEVFGPVLSITRVRNDLEAVTVANDSEYGLAAAVISQDPARAEAVALQVQSGVCHINRSTFDDTPHAPVGGVKASGYGRFGGAWGIQEFTELRWITSPSDARRP
ncbi:aldehyde dehydrogenase family protein [Pacificoceanicola onchidii]|uniref:aldehyde dehydrogenase family protein n=1 Tax=Pacificoceanicola onchidii TaxID=2562685 RepID=UPI0010A5638D|nr:aldehyde dehydrogenase family protein [Pacificoceanicola onchidii]